LIPRKGGKGYTAAAPLPGDRTCAGRRSTVEEVVRPVTKTSTVAIHSLPTCPDRLSAQLVAALPVGTFSQKTLGAVCPSLKRKPPSPDAGDARRPPGENALAR